MHCRLSVISGLALVVAMAACGRSTGPGELWGALPDVRFAERTDRMLVPVPSAHSASPGTVTVYGRVRTPCLPYGASATARVEGTRLELVVTGRARNECPLDVVGALDYRADLVGVPSGTYLLSVTHRYADANWPDETVLTVPVTVD